MPFASLPAAGAGETAARHQRRLTDLLEKIALTRGLRGRVVLLLSGNALHGRSVIAEALNSLALDRGMLSVLIQVEPQNIRTASRPCTWPAACAHHRADNVVRPCSMLLSGQRRTQAGDIRSEFDIIVDRRHRAAGPGRDRKVWRPYRFRCLPGRRDGSDRRSHDEGDAAPVLQSPHCQGRDRRSGRRRILRHAASPLRPASELACRCCEDLVLSIRSLLASPLRSSSLAARPCARRMRRHRRQRSRRVRCRRWRAASISPASWTMRMSRR